MTEFFLEPNRGYGNGVLTVFRELKKMFHKAKEGEGPEELDVTGPAKKQFDFQGSLGNGGAMRVHPVALYTYHGDKDQVVKCARDTATITHTHKHGIHGAMLRVGAYS